MSIRFGIYLGNSTCSIAINKDGNIEVLANAAGDRVTPNVVSFRDSETVTGLAAQQGLQQHSRCTILHHLWALEGHVTPRTPQSFTQCPPIIYHKNSPSFTITSEDKTKQVTALETFKSMFKLLQEIAMSHTNEEDINAVLCVPAWCSTPIRSLLVDAATRQGFQILSCVTQPSAACLAYDLLATNMCNMNILSLHCGGTTVVASMLKVRGGFLSMPDSPITVQGGGNSITHLLMQHLAKEFYVKYKGDPMESRRSRIKLHRAAENAKQVLSTITTAQIHVESLWEGVDFSSQLTRARFEGIVSPAIRDALVPMTDLMQKAKLNEENVNKVVLTGGTCKIPKLQQMVTSMFSSAEVLCRVSPDEVLAMGAAAEAALCDEGATDDELHLSSPVPCLARDLYVKLQNSDVSECVFVRGTSVHSRSAVTIPVENSVANMQCCQILLFESNGNLSCVDDGAILAQIDLSDVDSDSDIYLEFVLRSNLSLQSKVFHPLNRLRKTFVIEAHK